MDRRIILQKIEYKPPRRLHSTFKYLLKCNICGKEFWVLGCNYKQGCGATCASKSCFSKWTSKITQGKIFTKKTKRKISQAVSGSNSHWWKGGRMRGENGYIYIWKPEHPFAAKKGGRKGHIPEHRLVMEEYIRRITDPRSEIVHHINGVKNDNRIENLQLLTLSEHQRLHAQLRLNFLK